MTINFFYPHLIKCAQPRWPSTLIKDFSSMLSPLMAHGSSISFERLQLVSIGIKLGERHFSSTVMTKDADGNFIRLAKNINLANDSYAQCIVCFFVRGQRQYFKHPEQTKVLATSRFPGIAKGDIEAFFAALGEVNTALYDRELAHLIGRREVMVPSSMLLACCLEYALDVAEIEPHAHFEINFFHAVTVGEQLAIGHVVENAKLSIALYAGDKMVVMLTAW